MWLSRVRVPDASAQPHTSRMRSSRDRTSGAPSTSATSRSNSRGVSEPGPPSTVTRRAARSRSRPPRRCSALPAPPAWRARSTRRSSARIRADDLPHAKRLGHVVVGSHAEADEQIGLVVSGRQHEDRHRPLRLDPATDLEAVEAGKHDVEHDEVRAVLEVGGHGTRPVVGLDDVEPLGAEAVCDGLVDRRVILDQEDSAHASSVGARLRASRVRRLEIV